jgi:hypothetical protein
MLQQVDHLLSKIVTLKSNPHYRMADVFYRRGLRYKDSTEKVIALSEFDGTILKSYLLANTDIESPNIPLLSELVDRAITVRKFHLPRDDELVVHIRAGDVVEHHYFLQNNFIEQIGKFENVRDCSLVICFAFQEFMEKGWWLFSEEKLQKNISMVTAMFGEMISAYPKIKFDVVSHCEIDRDFVYMLTAPHFIRDVGGFSDLVCDLRAYRGAQVGPERREEGSSNVIMPASANPVGPGMEN